MAETVKLADEATAHLPEDFEMTELGPLPQGWRVVKLGEVVRVIRNGLAKRQNRDAKGLPVTRIETIAEGKINPHRVGFVECLTDRDVERYRLLPGDILFSHINSESQIGKSAIYEGVPPILLHGMNLLLIRVDGKKCDPFFLNELLHYYRNRKFFMSIASRAVGQASINQGKMRNVPIPLPPLPEQQSIACVLRTVHRAQETTEKVLAAARELKKSLMRHLFTYGPVPVEEAGRVPLKETEIGLLPAHWQVVRLGKVFDIQQGKALSRKKDQGIRPRPFLRTANVHWGYIDLSTLDFMDFTPEEERKYALQEGDLLVCEGGDIGRSAIWENEVSGIYYQNHLHRLRRKTENVEPRFYMYWLQAALTLLGLYRGTGNKTTIPNLSRTRLGAFAIPLPPLPEQQEIARILQAVDRRIQAEEQHKQALETLFKTLLHDLMTAKRRLPGEFVAQFAKEQEGRP